MGDNVIKRFNEIKNKKFPQIWHLSSGKKTSIKDFAKEHWLKLNASGKLIFKEINDLIIESIPIVAILSFFIGGVVAIQTALNLSSPFLSKSLIGSSSPSLILLNLLSTKYSIAVLSISKPITKPIVCRIDGNNAVEGRRILDESGIALIERVETMDDAARRVAQLAAGK